MKHPFLYLALSSFILTGCSEERISSYDNRYDTSVALYEIRSELADLRHNLSNAQVQLQLIEDTLEIQETSSQEDAQNTEFTRQISSLEKRVQKIEKENDLLASYAKETSAFLTDYKGKLQEVEVALSSQKKLLSEAAQLKTKISSLSHSLEEGLKSQGIYKVQPGDSLEKIARLYKTSVKALKGTNHLVSDIIIPGQELQIPEESKR